MRESRHEEHKATITPSFLKTVSAFANEGGGDIIFGIDDEGAAVGVDDPDRMRLDIENAVNDALDPRPRFSLETRQSEGTSVVVLHVEEGAHKPYLYRGRAYGRSDTATVPLDSASIQKIAAEGSHRSFEGERAPNQNLSFVTLRRLFESALGVDASELPILKTLGLYRGDSFDNAAALLSDENPYPGMELIRYDSDGNTIFERETLDGMSVLEQLEQAMGWFSRYYQAERVEGLQRSRIELIPERAFREAAANALAHRDWLVKGRITVSMYPDRIVVVSPGGLPDGMDEELYLGGDVSVPRNETLAYVLLRLGIIERLGTGVRRIRQAYEETGTEPAFEVMTSAIRVMLPAVEVEGTEETSEKIVRDMLSRGSATRQDIEKRLGVSRASVSRLLKNLLEQGEIKKEGQGRSTTYRAAP